MKHLLAVAFMLVLSVVFTASAVAGKGPDKETKTILNKDLIEENLINGVNSDNFGLRTSSAQMLGEIQSKRGVFALMRMLKSETDERARIVAALALYKIGDPIGIYAIKQQARFDDSQRVRRLCAIFYAEYKNNHTEG
jgi:HEAT repeat protein